MPRYNILYLNNQSDFLKHANSYHLFRKIRLSVLSYLYPTIAKLLHPVINDFIR